MELPRVCLHRGAWLALFLAVAVDGTIWLRRDMYDCSHGYENLPVQGKDPMEGNMTLDECKASCEQEPECRGIMVPQGEVTGTCWLRKNVKLTQCRLSEVYDVWERIPEHKAPPEGTWESLGNATACRLSFNDRSEDGHGTVLVYGAPSAQACQGLCGTSDKCYGVEYEQKVFRCEVWTEPINYVAPVPDYECFAFHPRDFPTLFL